MLLNHLTKKTGNMEIDLNLIKPRSKQPRWVFNDKKIQELADSIKEHGVIEPVIVRPVPGGTFELIAGERRWRASRLLGNKTIPAVIKEENLSVIQVKVQSLVENVQREGLTPLETAMAIKDIMEESQKSEKKMTMEEAGKLLGFSKVRVHQLLNILKLPGDMLEIFCDRDDFNEMHARALMSLKNQPRGQKELFNKITGANLTGQQAMEWASRYLADLPNHSTISKMTSRWRRNFTSFKKEWNRMGIDERKLIIREMEDFASEVGQVLEELKK